MKNIAKSITLSLIIATTAFAEGQYNNNHFSINSLVDANNISNTQPLMMSLPATEGFAPNINVQIQQYPNSLDSYAKLSGAQFKQLNFKVIKNKKIKNTLVFEYSGNMQNRNLHWYAMAYKKGNNVYLITATSTESQWKKLSKKLIGCIKSFKLK